MRLIKIFKTRKLFLLNIFLTLYVAINLIGGERGLYSYFEKKNTESLMIKKEKKLSVKKDLLEQKNILLSDDIDLDYLDIVYREKLKFGKEDEILIKLK
jgi:cell division protein DivIC|tara:strand:+ start:1173 stop:1469 length:297 start_codon:yes stop_codon:yes gene_type:complete